MREHPPNCMREGCTATGEFYPVIVVYRETDHVRCIAGLVVCGICKVKIKKPEEVLAEPEKLQRGLRGMRMTLDWARFNSDEAKTYRRLQQKKN